MIRAFLPRASAVRVIVAGASPSTHDMAVQASRRPVRGRDRRRDDAGAVPVRSDVARQRRGHDRRRSVSIRPAARRSRSLPDRRGPPPATESGAGRAPGGDRPRRRDTLCRVGAQRPPRQRRRRLERVGRARASDATTAAARRVGTVRAGRRRRRALQVRTRAGRGRAAIPQGRSVRRGRRTSTGDRVGRLRRKRVRLAGRRVDRATGLAPRGARSADGDLRGAPRVVGAERRRRVPVVPGARDTPRRARPTHRLHARRTAAGAGVPLRRLLGLPGHRVLRADEPLRHARRLPRLRRRAPPRRHRRDPRLGPRTLPQGRARSRTVRRHRALRARRPATGRAQWTGAR